MFIPYLIESFNTNKLEVKEKELFRFLFIVLVRVGFHLDNIFSYQPTLAWMKEIENTLKKNKLKAGREYKW